MTTTLPTDANRTRTAAEVKRMLHEIAFVIRISQRIKMEIVSEAHKTVRPLAPATDNTLFVPAAA
jgi:hypothetical protein